MIKTRRFFFIALIITTFICYSCVSTGDTSEAKSLITGTWIEDPNREGNVETGIWGADGSFTAEIKTPNGDLVEKCIGSWAIKNNQIVLTITKDAGEWSGFELADIELTTWYNYRVTDDTLHLERTKRSIFGNEEEFNPPLNDDYRRK